MDTPTYNTAVFLSKLLTPFTNKSNVKLKNSYTAKELLSN